MTFVNYLGHRSEKSSVSMVATLSYVFSLFSAPDGPLGSWLSKTEMGSRSGTTDATSLLGAQVYCNSGTPVRNTRAISKRSEEGLSTAGEEFSKDTHVCNRLSSGFNAYGKECEYNSLRRRIPDKA